MKKEYLNELTELSNNFKENSVRLKNEGANDEAVFETIKANVCDIFTTLFEVSYKKSFVNPTNTKENYRKLNSTYNDFFDKIPAPWKEKMAKDKENNMFEEFHKEEIKLEMVGHIRELYEKCYNKYYKGEEK